MYNRLTQSETFNQGRKGARMDAESFAYYLASEYSKYVKDDYPKGRYELDICDIPDNERREFAALIMASDDSLASEATGPDNSLFDKKMLPSLVAYMKNPSDMDSMARLAEDWANGTSSYLRTKMQDMIDSELELINSATYED